MSNLQIYLWFGVPGMTALIVFGIVLDWIHYRVFIARFDASDASFRERERQRLDIR